MKWVKGFEVIGANTVNKDYYERLLKEKNENGIGLHEDSIEEIERKKAINRMNKLQNLTNRKKAQRRQIRKEEDLSSFSTFTQTAGGYSFSGTWAGNSEDVFFTSTQLANLGIGRATISQVSL